MTTKPTTAALKLKDASSLDELRDKAESLGLPTETEEGRRLTKLDLAQAILAHQEAAPPVPPATRAEAMARAQDQDFLPPDEEATPPPVPTAPTAPSRSELDEAREAAQAAEEESRDINKPDPKAAAQGKNVKPVPRQGRLRHTGRWIPKEVLQYKNTRGHRVVRKPEIHVPGFGMVPNVLDDIPDGIAQNAHERGLLEPELA